MPLQLWDRGFDIWVGTFRGNEGTNCNPAKECNDNPLYNWADKGDKDIPALVDKVDDLKGAGKVNVIARTTGASALLYGLATTDYLNGLINEAILLAPQIYTETDMPIEDYRIWTALRSKLGINNTTMDNLAEQQTSLCNAALSSDYTDREREILKQYCAQL